MDKISNSESLKQLGDVKNKRLPHHMRFNGKCHCMKNRKFDLDKKGNLIIPFGVGEIVEHLQPDGTWKSMGVCSQCSLDAANERYDLQNQETAYRLNEIKKEKEALKQQEIERGKK